jgi:hypothetical protein
MKDVDIRCYELLEKAKYEIDEEEEINRYNRERLSRDIYHRSLDFIMQWENDKVLHKNIKKSYPWLLIPVKIGASELTRQYDIDENIYNYINRYKYEITENIRAINLSEKNWTIQNVNITELDEVFTFELVYWSAPKIATKEQGFFSKILNTCRRKPTVQVYKNINA